MKLPARWPILLVTLAGFGLRAAELGRQSLWFDEAFSVVVAGINWLIFWAALLTDGVHPPGYYLLLRGWLALAGSSEFAARWPSVLAGALAIPLLYQLGRALHSRKLGLASAALLALNPFALWYAQEARMYSLLLALTLVSGLAFWRLLAQPGLKWAALLAAATALNFQIHYFAFAFSLVQFVLLLATLTKTHRALRWWAAAQAAAIGPFLPWAWAVAGREGGSFGINWIPPVTALDLPLTLSNLAFALSDPSQPLTWLALLLASAALATGVIGLYKKENARPMVAGFLLVWLLLPPLALWLMSLKQPLYVDRYFILSLPALLLLLASAALLPRGWGNAALGLLLAASLAGSLRLFTDPALQKEAWRAVAQQVQTAAQPGDALLIHDMQASIPFGYYYRGALPAQIASINDEVFPLAGLIGDSRRVWLVYRRPFQATHNLSGSEPFGWQAETQLQILDWLQAHRPNLAEETTLPGVYLLRFDLR